MQYSGGHYPHQSTTYGQNRVNQNYPHPRPQMTPGHQQQMQRPMSYLQKPIAVKRPEEEFYRAAKDKLSERAMETLNQLVKDVENINKNQDHVLIVQLTERKNQINALVMLK